MAVLDGTGVVIAVAGAKVNGLVDNSIDETVDTIEVTTKDSSGHKEYIAGEDGWTISASGKIDLTDTTDITVLRTAKAAKAAVAVMFGNGILTTGGQILSGSAIITALNQTAPKNGELTWSATFQGTGALTESTSATTLT